MAVVVLLVRVGCVKAVGVRCDILCRGAISSGSYVRVWCFYLSHGEVL